MALTRGSRGESMDNVLLPQLSRGDRATSLSRERMRRIRAGSNPTPLTRSLDSGIAKKKGRCSLCHTVYFLTSDPCITEALDNEKFMFPSNVAPTLDRLEHTQHRNQDSTHTISGSLKKNSGRARTPQSRTPRVVRLSTPTTPSPRPIIVRANSQGNNRPSQNSSSNVIGPLPRSVRRWARTAHVHEIKKKSIDSGVSSQSEAEIETPNDSSKVVWLNKGKQRETEAEGHTPFFFDRLSRRGSIGRSSLRPMPSSNVNPLDTEATDSWVDTDDASSSEADVYLNRRKERFTKSTDTLTIRHRPSPGLVGVGAS